MRIRHSVFLSAFLLALLELASLQSLPAAGIKALGFQPHLDRMQLCAGQVGIHVVSLQSGKTVCEHNGDETFIPASLVKLFTSYAALKSLGPDCRFTTSIWALDPPVQGRIGGNIWIRGEGDIFFLSEDASNLAGQLKGLGVTRVEGSLFVDNSYFEPQSMRVCLDWNCTDAYNPIISGTSLNFNSFQFNVLPGLKPRAPVHVSWTPAGDYVQLKNEGSTGPRKVAPSLNIRSLGFTREGRESFHVSGCLPVTAKGGVGRRFTVQDPATFLGRAFGELLRSEGIEVRSADTGAAKVPAHAKKLASHESLPLKDLLHGLNRHSNNFMAETLLCSLGAKASGNPGSMQKGLAIVHRHLRELGIPEKEARLENGSGLSRQSRASPRAFSRVLVASHADPCTGFPLVESLAVNGQPGTLRKRVCNSPLVIRGKTGTLSNVMGFAGYVSLPGSTGYAVTVILNDVQDLSEAKKALDSFLKSVPLLPGSH